MTIEVHKVGRFINICARMHIYIYMYVHTCVSLLWMSICTFVYIHMYICLCIYTHISFNHAKPGHMALNRLVRGRPCAQPRIDRNVLREGAEATTLEVTPSAAEV